MSPITPNIEPKPSPQCRKPVADGFVKAVVAGRLRGGGYFDGSVPGSATLVVTGSDGLGLNQFCRRKFCLAVIGAPPVWPLISQGAEYKGVSSNN